MDHPLQFGVEQHYLVYPRPTSKSRVGALAAPFALLEQLIRAVLPADAFEEIGRRVIGRFARRADLSRKPLGDKTQHRRGKQKGLDTHVQQAHHTARAVVGVQGRQHQVSRQRRLDRNPRRLLVANLPDHDHVGILTQDRAKRPHERQADRLADLNLIDKRQLILHGVFDRHDIGGFVPQQIEGRVKRGGLAASGRAGHEHQTVRIADHRFDCGPVLPVYAEILELEAQVTLVENPDDDLFSKHGRHARYAQVDLMLVRDDVNTPFLRQPFFGDIHPADDFDA